MKLQVSFVLIFLFCTGNLFSQINFKEMVFCHDETKKLQFISSDKYQMSFNKQKIEKFQLKNGTLFYDLEKNVIQFSEKGKPIIKVELQNNGIVSVSDLRTDKIYTRSPIKDSETCVSQANNFENIYADSVMILFAYTYCRLVGVSISTVNFGSVNLFPLQKIGRRNFSWDFMYTSDSNNRNNDVCVKILTDRKSALPDFISISNKVDDAERFKTSSGIEITGKANNFNKITLVTQKGNSTNFEFQDILKYTKKGKLIEAKEEINVTNCDNQVAIRKE